MEKTDKQHAVNIAAGPYAIIDIGSTGIRMVIAEVTAEREIRTLDFLYQDVSLGRDCFRDGNLSDESINESIRTLKSFKKLLDDYQIRSHENIRTIASTAVRESSNSDVFIDRVAVSTGFTVEIINDEDIARCIFLSFLSNYSREKWATQEDIIISEISGGLSFVMQVSKGNVIKFATTRFGTLRTNIMLESTGAPDDKQPWITEKNVKRTVDKYIRGTVIKNPWGIVSLGYDIWFAQKHIKKSEKQGGMLTLKAADIEKLAREIMSKPVYQNTKRYGLSLTDAESVGPALLYYANFARSLKIKKVFCSSINMRDGLLLEMARQKETISVLEQQVRRSAMAAGKKFGVDNRHAEYVANTSDTIFDSLKKEHGLEHWMKTILKVASILHDAGMYINTRNHHKHSMYIINNSELFGIGSRQKYLAALIARYHRGAGPKVSHRRYTSLNHTERLLVSKLAAILRIADSLDRTNNQHLKDIRCIEEGDNFILEVNTPSDLTLEEMAVNAKGNLFRKVFGMNVILRKTGV